MTQVSSLLKLKPAIITGDMDSARVLKTIMESQTDYIQSIEIGDRINTANSLFRDKGCNCLFIDIFTLDVKQAIEFINHVRNTYPMVPICLYSKLTDLTLMPEVNDYWQRRFEHYFKLPCDQNVDELIDNTQYMLRAMSHYLQNDVVLDKVSGLAKRVQEESGNLIIEREQKSELEETLATIEQVLKNREQFQRSNLISIVPGISTDQIERLVNETLKDANKSLNTARLVNMLVLLGGSLLVATSFFIAATTARWEAIAFGGLGMAGIIAALITSPLKAIGTSANQIIQVQIVYFQFLSQLRLLSQDGKKTNVLERSKRLEEAMGQTVKALIEHRQ
mgnify:CR=1 FL=1